MYIDRCRDKRLEGATPKILTVFTHEWWDCGFLPFLLWASQEFPSFLYYFWNRKKLFWSNKKLLHSRWSTLRFFYSTPRNWHPPYSPSRPKWHHTQLLVWGKGPPRQGGLPRRAGAFFGGPTPESLGKILNTLQTLFSLFRCCSLGGKEDLKSDPRVRPGVAQAGCREEAFPGSKMFLEQEKQGENWEVGGPAAWTPVPAPLFTPGWFLNLSKPQFPHLQNDVSEGTKKEVRR